MPAAANWELLEDYEAQFDFCLPLVLAPFAAAPYSFDLFGQEDLGELTTPRIEYSFTIGEPVGPGSSAQQRPGGGLAGRRAVARNFSLSFRVIYDRTKIDLGALGLRGALRQRLAPEAQAFDVDTLPWLGIAALNEVRAPRGVQKAEESPKLLSVWESLWDGVFIIRPEAMP